MSITFSIEDAYYGQIGPFPTVLKKEEVYPPPNKHGSGQSPIRYLDFMVFPEVMPSNFMIVSGRVTVIIIPVVSNL